VDWDQTEAGYAEGYDHLAILALTVEAVKELAAQNRKLELQNQIMRERIGNLERKLAAS
jgi:hypothetical protein